MLLGTLSLFTDSIIPWFAGNPIDSIDLTSRGEPLIISAALVAAGIGELIFDRKSSGLSTLPVTVAMSISVVFVIVLGICYGAVKYSGNSPARQADPHIAELALSRLSTASWIFLGAAVLISGMCVILSELEP